MIRRWPAAILVSAGAILALLGIISGGCGKGPETTTVSGAIQLQSAPLARGAVTFFPERGRPTTAATNDAGRYSVDLAPGAYKVTVNIGVQLPPGWKEGDPVPPQQVTIPLQYTSRVNTPLRTTVTAVGAEPTDFALP